MPLLCSLIMINCMGFFYSNANVVIKTVRKPCVCEQNKTLTCIVKEYDKVAWMIKGDVIPIAKCIMSSCKYNPAYNKKYTFSYDIDKQVFNLTIINVTIADSGRTLICSDGDHLDSWTLSVRVAGYEPMLIEDTENGTITVNSGCSSNGNTDISFKWIKINSDGEELIYNPDTETVEQNCANNCRKEQHRQFYQTVKVDTTVREGYSLKCEVVYQNESIQSKISSKKYQIDEQDDDLNPNVNAYSTLDLAISLVFLVLLTFILIYINRRMIKSCIIDRIRSDRCQPQIVENNEENPDEKYGEIAAQTNDQLSDISEKSKEEKNTDYTGKAELAQCQPLISCSDINKEPDVMENMKISPDIDDVPFTDMTVIQGDQCPHFYPSVEGITTQNPEPQPDLESKIISLRRYSKSGKKFTI